MELCCDVRNENSVVGKIYLAKQGLYCKLRCKCILNKTGIYRLHLKCFGTDRNLGVLIPDQMHYVLESTIAAKYVDFDHPQFYITGLRDNTDEEFVPICSDRPFAYIHKLENARIAIRDGKIGIMVSY